MSTTTIFLLLIPVAYLLGSIPFGLIVGLAKGVDPRKGGSGNIGATNVGRLLGGKYFALVFLLDMLKGLLPMLAGAWILHGNASQTGNLLWLLVGFAAIAGHIFSVFLGFKGGKGVATAAGVALGVYPFFTLSAVIAILAFMAVFFLTRIVSIASIIAAIILPISYISMGLVLKWDIFGAQLPLLIFVIVLSGLVIYRHRSNIRRLMAGTEHRFERIKKVP